MFINPDYHKKIKSQSLKYKPTTPKVKHTKISKRQEKYKKNPCEYNPNDPACKTGWFGSKPTVSPTSSSWFNSTPSVSPTTSSSWFSSTPTTSLPPSYKPTVVIPHNYPVHKRPSLREKNDPIFRESKKLEEQKQQVAKDRAKLLQNLENKKKGSPDAVFIAERLNQNNKIQEKLDQKTKELDQKLLVAAQKPNLISRFSTGLKSAYGEFWKGGHKHRHTKSHHKKRSTKRRNKSSRRKRH
jgi:hypothetical protein